MRVRRWRWAVALRAAMAQILPVGPGSGAFFYNRGHSEERCSAHQPWLAAGVRLGTLPFATTLIHWSSAVSPIFQVPRAAQWFFDH